MSGVVLTDAPVIALPQLMKAEAEAIASMDAVLRRYQLIEWVRCRGCNAANRQDGCRVTVTPRMVRILCRCGTREFVAPQGTSDLGANRANSALTQANTGEITVVTGDGKSVKLKAVKLELEDAAIIRFYDRITGQLQINPKWAHKPCWSGRVWDGHEMEILINPSQIALRCSCRCLHFAGSTDN